MPGPRRPGPSAQETDLDDRSEPRLNARDPQPRHPRPGRHIRANLSTAELYEDAIRDGEGLIAADGPLVVRTGNAHRALAAGQVHRRRAVEPRTRSGGARSTTRSPRSTTTGFGRA